METHPQVVAHGSFFTIGNNKICIKTLDYPSLKVGLVFDNMFLHPSLMIKKETLEQVNFYNETYVCSSDYDLVCKLALQGEICNIPEVLMFYRVHPQQITSTQQKKQIGYANYIRLDYLDKSGFELNNQQQILLTKIRHKIKLTTQETKEKPQLYTSLISQNHSLKVFHPHKFEDILNKIFQ